MSPDLAELIVRAADGDELAEVELAELLDDANAESWRATPATFAEHLSRGRWRPAAHLEALSDKLSEAAYGEDRRIVVSMPVRHGKSWLTSMWFPVWYLDRWPDRKIILVGHGADFARKWGRRVRNLIVRHADELRVRLAPDMKAADAWETTEGGGMITAGIGGAINGEGANLLLVDDYCKNAKQAQSKPWRDSVQDFWDSTAETRMEPGASCVIVATRWHEDDLIGRLVAGDEEEDLLELEQLVEGEGLSSEQIHRAIDRWEEVVFPAVAEENDPLGRAPGEALWPERWPLWRLDRKRRAKGPWVWAALYQQRPSPAEGGFFRSEWLKYYQRSGDLIRYRHAATGDARAIRLASLTKFVTVDLAASLREAADYTVVATFGVSPDGTLFVLNVERAKVEGPGMIPLIEAQLDRWGASTAWIESAGFQLHLIQTARRRGLAVRELKADSNKLARALPATAEFEAGALLLPAQADWLDDFIAELLAFPGGAHDDQVDAIAYAVQVGLDLLASTGVVYGLSEVVAADEDRDRLLDRLDRGGGSQGLWD